MKLSCVMTFMILFGHLYAVEIANVNPPYDNDSILPNGQRVAFKLSDINPVKVIMVSNVGIHERLLISHIRVKIDEDIDITVRDKNDKIIGDFRSARKDNGSMISVENTKNSPFIVYCSKTKMGDIDVQCYFSIYSVQQIEKAFKSVADDR